MQAAGAAALALLLMGASMADPLIGLLAKACVEPFFHSTSAGAAASLFGLVSLGLLGIAFAPLAPTLSRARPWGAGLLVCVLIGNMASLAAHLRILSNHSVPWSMAVYHWAGETNTYSYVLHSHTGKVALHTLLAGWSAPWTKAFDIGAGLASQVPPVLAAMCLLSVVLAATAYAVLLPLVMARWPGWPMPLLFAFCALNSLKCIVDGGPLTYRFAPVFAVLLWLLLDLMKMSQRTSRLGIAAATCVILASSVTSWVLAGPQADEALHGLVGTLAVLGALGACAWRPGSAPLRAVRNLVLVVSTAATLACLAASLIATPMALLLPLPIGMQATVCDSERNHCEQHAVAGKRAFDVYRRHGDDPLKPRHTLLSITGQVGESRLTFAIHPISTRPATGSRAPAADDAVTVQPLGPLRHGSGVLVESRSTVLPTIFNATPGPFTAANYYVFLHQTAAVLRFQGLDEYIMAPLRSQADARALGLATSLTRAPTSP